MIIERALYPEMTRLGLGYPIRVPLGKRGSDEFPETNEGRWLVPFDVSERGLDLASSFILEVVGQEAKHASQLETELELAAVAISGARLVDYTGCWITDQDLNEDELMIAGRTIAEFDRGRPILNPANLIDHDNLRICDCPDCLNPRHHDHTYRLPFRSRLIEPDRNAFRKTKGGKLKTSWDVVLPSLEESIAAFRKLQEQCPPYKSEVDSPLTAHGISQITIHETGCWMVRNYFTRTDTVISDKDGYGRLTLRKRYRNGNGSSRTQRMAHSVTWVVTGNKLEKGKELNHLCMCRPCAFPGHLEQVNRREHHDFGVRSRNSQAA